MTIEEKKAWLDRYWLCELEVRSLERQKEEASRDLLRVTPTYLASSRGSKDPHGKETLYDKIVRLSREVDEAIDRKYDMMVEIEQAIEGAQTYRQKMVLRLRHINCMIWDDIAVAMHYSIEGKKIFKLYNTALLNLKIGN